MSNWGDLTSDLLDSILSNLFGKDRISFSLVCKPWNAVAADSQYGYSPCLMYYYRRTRTWKFYQYNDFFNMSFPELEDADIRCSKYGWLLMSRHDGALFFFDPSNSQKVELPCKVGHGYTSLCFFNPPTSSECIVVGIQTPICMRVAEICTLKRGQSNWESMEYHIESTFLVSLGAPVLHRGLIYFLSVKGDVAILDIKQRRFDVYFKCLRCNDMEIKEQYLVKVKGEEAVYGVFVFNGERKVKVFRLSSDMKWELVEGIGDKVLYLGHTSSFGGKARSKSMENTICFPEFHGDAAVFYSLSDGKYHSVSRDYMEGNAYGLKRLDSAAWLVMPMPSMELMSWH